MNHLLSCVLGLLFLCAFAPLRASGFCEPVPQSQKEATHYSCTMHPAIKSKSAGRCPKCGMKLVPSKTTNVAHVVGPPERLSSVMSIPDVELLDQEGRKVSFYRDLVKGKIVAINFIFTTCTTICPPMGATFARVEKELGSRDAHFISVSVDPVTDTPERLKAWSAKFKAGPRFHARAGWSFLTGTKENVDWALYKLGQYVQDKNEHKTIVIIGNEATGLWKKAFGLANAEDLIKIVEEVAGDKGVATK